MVRRRQDHWAKRAKAERYRARSAYKLIEIDDRFKLLKKGIRVLDLGCAPGSWLQVAAERVGGAGIVVGLDLKQTEPVAKNVIALKSDVLNGAPELDEENGLPSGFDVVLSDMAPNTSGIKDADHYRSMDLAEHAMEIAWKRSGAGAGLVIKVFQGPDLPAFLKRVKSRYSKVSATRPDSTRRESREIFIVARNRREKMIDVR